MTDIKPIKWNLADLWNSVAIKDNRPLKARDYIYASEIGGPMYDRYLKMNAVPYTNPPNARSLRKFMAGNIWEHVTKQVLIATGVYRKEEVKFNDQPYKGGLEVHGRCDFIAGGYIEANVALARLELLALPDFLNVVGNKIITAMAGKNLEEMILELKSVSTFAMDKVERSRAAIPSHMMQGYHYQRGGKMPAAIGYICKDDCRMAQFEVEPDKAEPLYEEDVMTLTEYYKHKIKPVLEPLARFDDVLGKFSKNLAVEYSPYLSHYGFKTPDEFRNAVKFVDRWNRTLTRYVLVDGGKETPSGQKMAITPKNKECRAEIEKAGYKFADLLELKIKIGAVEEEEVEA